MANLVTIDLDQVQADIAEHVRKLDELRVIERALLAYGSNGHRPKINGHSAVPAITQTRPPVTVTSDEIADLSFHEAAALVLSRAGGPMKTKDIVAALQSADFGTNVDNIDAITYTAMFRKPEIFERISRGTWALVNGATE